jgi:flavin reductase (DIM6/NTAB) family NADH-FMN oxidoreductase RutF
MDPKTKQKALRLITNGMYVLTSRSEKHFTAATVTWVSQVSFKPPLLMIAVRKGSAILRCLVASRAAVLHILGSHQKDIAQKFFSPTKEGRGSLNGESFIESKTCIPIFNGLPAYAECKVVDIREEYGDHAIVILEVIDAQLREEVKPLVVAESPWHYGG